MQEKGSLRCRDFHILKIVLENDSETLDQDQQARLENANYNFSNYTNDNNLIV